MKKNIIQILFAVLGIVSAGEAWAGMWLHRGLHESRIGRLPAAIEQFEKAGCGPGARMNLGKSLYVYGVQSGDKEFLRRAESVFTEMTETWPFYGRSWIYRGLSRAAYEKTEGSGALSAVDRRRIKEWFVRGILAEPGSGWAHYTAASQILQWGGLTAAERSMARRWLDKAAEYSPPPRHPSLKVNYSRLSSDLIQKYFKETSPQ